MGLEPTTSGLEVRRAIRLRQWDNAESPGGRRITVEPKAFLYTLATCRGAHCGARKKTVRFITVVKSDELVKASTMIDCKYLHFVETRFDLASKPNMYIDSVRDHAPNGFEFKYWGLSDLEKVVRKHCGNDAAQEFGRCPGIVQADWGRYMVLYDQGGIYIDTDVWAVAPVTKLFESWPPSRVWLAQSPSILPFQKPGVTNFVMASPPRHDFWLMAAKEILQRRTVPVMRNYAPFCSGAWMLTSLRRLDPAVQTIPTDRLGNLLCYNCSRAGTIATHVGQNQRNDKAWNPGLVIRIFRVECWMRSWLGMPLDRWQFPVAIVCLLLLAFTAVRGPFPMPRLQRVRTR